jgi:hypothetical protein
VCPQRKASPGMGYNLLGLTEALSLLGGVQMKQSRWVLLAVAAVFPLIGSCASNGDECDVCTADVDCKAGFTCVDFKDESGQPAGKRCGSGLGSTACRVR